LTTGFAKEWRQQPDSLAGIENLIGNGQLVGDDGPNVLRTLWFGVIVGAGGDDVLDGDGTSRGGSGDDVLAAGFGVGGYDIDGGPGVDTVRFELPFAMFVDLTESIAYRRDSGSESDPVLAIENVRGTAGDDVIIGDANANLLIGGAGHDTINARAGSDTLHGGQGNDNLDGAAGNDTCAGGPGTDTTQMCEATTGAP
jgi:serralysin